MCGRSHFQEQRMKPTPTTSSGMKQSSKTDYGERGETGEKMPAGVKSSDSGGEKSGSMKGGVAMGKADGSGSQEGSVGRKGFGQQPDRGEFNTGRSESTCYNHKRLKHTQN
jgi:hypothetical protein